MKTLSEPARKNLSDWFPDLDLAAVRVHDENGRRDRLILGVAKATAVTVGTRIFARPGSLSPSSPEGLALIAHELVHVRQFKRHGFLGFAARYLWQYLLGRKDGLSHWQAYRRNPFEAEAHAMQAAVVAQLSAEPPSKDAEATSKKRKAKLARTARATGRMTRDP